jgi:hypothetical protein
VGDGTINANVNNSGIVYAVDANQGIATFHINGNYTQDSSGQLLFALASPASYDKVVISGNAALGGTLSVETFGFTPQLGQSFDILDWGSVSGSFLTLNLPPLDPSLMWSPLDSNGVIRVLAATVGLPGDFNQDGKVDAADYVKWRKNETANSPLPNDNGLTTQVARFNLWRSNFGNMSGSGSVASSPAAPEPHALILGTMGLVILCGIRRRS